MSRIPDAVQAYRLLTDLDDTAPDVAEAVGLARATCSAKWITKLSP